MKQYKTYRINGAKLSDRIPEALEHFELCVKKPPVSLVVHHRNVTEATIILKSLNLATLDVIGNGGVALSEIWLQEPSARK